MNVSRIMRRLSGMVAIAALTPLTAGAAVIYADRTSFESQLSASITDDYSGYTGGSSTILSDAAMSAVLGETSYRTTGFTNWNIVVASGADYNYCSGCNGSYLLDFTTTSVGTAIGVFGVGLDIASAQNVFGTTAFVTFGDGSTANYAIPVANAGTGDKFWGITDDLLIASIHFGLVDGGTNTDNSIQRMAMDDLTIGAKRVPEPGTLLLISAGLFGLQFSRRKRALKI